MDGSGLSGKAWMQPQNPLMPSDSSDHGVGLGLQAGLLTFSLVFLIWFLLVSVGRGT